MSPHLSARLPWQLRAILQLYDATVCYNAGESEHAIWSMGDTMARIFISYRRQETIDIAGRIYDWLAHSGLAREDIFMDVDSIALAVDFREAVYKAIIQSDLVLVIIGQQWLTLEDARGRRLDSADDSVRIEIETALRQHLAVLPILVQGATMPAAAQLPESIRGMAYLNALTVRSAGPDFKHDMESLLAFIMPAQHPRSGVTSSTPAVSIPSAATLHSSDQPTNLVNWSIAARLVRNGIHRVSRVPLRTVTVISISASLYILWWCVFVFGPRLFDPTNLAAPFILSVAIGSCLFLLLNSVILLSNTLIRISPG